MLIRVGGGKGGFREYLETGRKAGRDMHRNQLDQRVSLHGDLMAFEITTNAHIGDGDKYTHFTFSFSENYVSDDIFQSLVLEFRDFSLSAWPEAERDRIPFYAEAHLPKIKSYIDKNSGETVPRFPHIHIGIGCHDLLTKKRAAPFSITEHNIKFIDAFQESFNARHGLTSPKDSPRITFENAVETIARYTGSNGNTGAAFFGIRDKEIRAEIQREVLQQKIESWSDFRTILSKRGSVTTANTGKPDEYYRLAIPGAKHPMRLRQIAFSKKYIELTTSEKQSIIMERARSIYRESQAPRKTDAHVSQALNEWHESKAKENRYVHTGSTFYRNVYQPADKETRRQLLKQLEANERNNSTGDNFHVTSTRKTHYRQIATTRSRLPELRERTLDGIQRRSEMLLPPNAGVHVGATFEPGPNCLELRRLDGSGSTTEHANAGTGDHNSCTVQWRGLRASANGGGEHQSGSGHDGLHERQASSIVEFCIQNLRERFEQSNDKEQYTEIRKHLDCHQLLNQLSHSHGLNRDLYSVTISKDGTPRIQCGTRALTPNDFLTKEMALPWRDAAPILREVYSKQVGATITKPASRTPPPSNLWASFRAGRDVQEAAAVEAGKQLTTNSKVRRVELSAAIKESRAKLKGAEKKAAILSAATTRAELEVVIAQERARLRVLPIKEAWPAFLAERTETGDEQALAELRKINARPVREEPDTPAFVIRQSSQQSSQANAEKAARLFRSMSYTISLDGVVTYSIAGRAALRDEGPWLAVLNENDPSVIAAGLRMASEKFGATLTLTGSVEFQRRAVEIAVAQGIPVHFSAPELEKYRSQLVTQHADAVEKHRQSVLSKKTEQEKKVVFSTEHKPPTPSDKPWRVAPPLAAQQSTPDHPSPPVDLTEVVWQPPVNIPLADPGHEMNGRVELVPGFVVQGMGQGKKAAIPLSAFSENEMELIAKAVATNSVVAIKCVGGVVKKVDFNEIKLGVKTRE